MPAGTPQRGGEGEEPDLRKTEARSMSYRVGQSEEQRRRVEEIRQDRV